MFSLFKTEPTVKRSLLFYIAMWWRIVYGFLRTGAALALIPLVGTPFSELFNRLIVGELIEDPHDIFVHITGPFVAHVSFKVTYFFISYLIFWAVIDFVTSVNLLLRKHWAYPSSLTLISFFISYEVYRFTHTHSFVLLYMITIDMIILWLIADEYVKLKALHSQHLDPESP